MQKITIFLLLLTIVLITGFAKADLIIPPEPGTHEVSECVKIVNADSINSGQYIIVSLEYKFDRSRRSNNFDGKDSDNYAKFGHELRIVSPADCVANRIFGATVGMVHTNYLIDKIEFESIGGIYMTDFNYFKDKQNIESISSLYYRIGRVKDTNTLTAIDLNYTAEVFENQVAFTKVGEKWTYSDDLVSQVDKPQPDLPPIEEPIEPISQPVKQMNVFEQIFCFFKSIFTGSC